MTESESTNVTHSYPLTPLQTGMLVNTLAAPGSGVDVLHFALEFDELLEREALDAAWQHVVSQHEVLRTVMRWEQVETPCQDVLREVRIPVTWDDFSAAPEDQREALWQDLVRADRRAGFDLSQGPLMRIRAALCSPPSETRAPVFRVLWSLHHVLLDGPGLMMILAQVFSAYDELRRGTAPADLPLAPPPPATFFDYVSWSAALSHEGAEAFWRERLAGLEGPTRLSLDRAPARRDDGEPRGFPVCERRLSADMTKRLGEWTRAHGLTKSTVVQGAWALVSSRLSGQRTISFGAIKTMRASSLEGANRIPGLFLNTLPVVIDVDPEAVVIDWLVAVRRSWVAMRDHEHTPLVDIQGWGRTEGALFDSIYCYDPQDYGPALAEELERTGGQDGTRPRSVGIYDQTNYPIVLKAFAGAEFLLRLSYDADCFSADAIERLTGYIETAIEGLMSAKTATLGEISLVSEDEARSLAAFAGRPSPYPRDRRVDELFAEQAAHTPDAPAVIGGGHTLSYRELEQRSARLARALDRLGVEPGERVAVALGSSSDLIVAMLGTLAAGCVYVPIDPAYPHKRIELLVADTGARFVLTNGRWAPPLESLAAQLVRVDQLDEDLPAEPAPASSSAGPSDARAAAYVIYTSGSTGVPKGVCVPHRAIVRLVRDTGYFELQPGDRFGQAASPSFDAATFEIWGALLNGASVVIVEKEVALSAPNLRRRIDECGITVMWVTAALFHQLVLEDPTLFAPLRYLLVGGDVVDPARIRDIFEHGRPGHVLNGYGPTENTTFSATYEVDDLTQIEGGVPIGRPISNSTCHVLDEHGELVPIGVRGELCVGGDGLALGYLNDPQLTAQRFVASRFGSRDGARGQGPLYRTGDLVAWRPDGVLEFFGRVDAQVKLRGHRVEPGEVESLLLSGEDVQEAVVIVREDTPGDRRLVAYVVTTLAEDEVQDILGEHLRQSLPPYMIPSAIVALDRLPLNANGKVDRSALPAPQSCKMHQEYVEPADETEQLIADIWRELLDVQRVGALDRFFALGGHSLLAMRVVSRLRAATGFEVPLQRLFDDPSARALARHIETLRWARDGEAASASSPASSEGIEEFEL